MLIYFYIIITIRLVLMIHLSLDILSNKLNYFIKSVKDSVISSYSLGWNFSS